MSKISKNNTERIIDIFYDIQNTQGTLAKKEILKLNEDDGAFQYVLKWYFNNLIVSGLGQARLNKQIDCMPNYEYDGLDIEHWGLIDLLAYVQENNTGSDYVVGVVQTFGAKFNAKTAVGIDYIVTKSWTGGLGIGRTEVNNVYGKNFVPEFKVQLCAKYADNLDYWEGKKFALQVKLDGYCFILVKKNGKIKLFSRSGKETPASDFPEIEKEALALKEDNFILHGERMPLGFNNMNNEEQFKLAASSMKKGVKKDFCIAVYDYLPLHEWEDQISDLPYELRYKHYTSMLKDCKYLYPLEALYIGTDESEIKKQFDKVLAMKKEGLIIKDMNASYEWERAIGTCKIKAVLDMDLPIIGFEEGRGQFVGILGALILDYNGTEVRCGSGLSKEQRKEIWDNKKKYLGKIVEINYMEECKSKGRDTAKLRHPIFKTFKFGD